MSGVGKLHLRAMALVDEAIEAHDRGDISVAEELTRQAFAAEHKAAMMVAGRSNAEPTRSVLLRSAATLALDCGEKREAERLIAIALSGDPPHEIAEELRDVVAEGDRVYNKTTRRYEDNETRVDALLER